MFYHDTALAGDTRDSRDDEFVNLSAVLKFKYPLNAL